MNPVTMDDVMFHDFIYSLCQITLDRENQIYSKIKKLRGLEVRTDIKLLFLEFALVCKFGATLSLRVFCEYCPWLLSAVI